MGMGEFRGQAAGEASDGDSGDEREEGVEFMRLSCTKSASVCKASLAEQTSQNPALEEAIRSVLPPPPPGKDACEEACSFCVRLLQQPDVAKYAISLAFRGALESDGVHLHFCDVHGEER